jgi:hypothetical protein
VCCLQLVKVATDKLPWCTDREATCLGILLTETIVLLEVWRKNKPLYEEECTTKQTFRTNVRCVQVYLLQSDAYCADLCTLIWCYTGEIL